MNPQSKGAALTVMGLLAASALLLGSALHPLAVDDAFITYRYAHNLAAGNGFTYNAGRPVLSTTAPLYALLLAAGVWAQPDPVAASGPSPASLPALANALSAGAIWVGAVLLFALGYCEKTPWVGVVAALLYVLDPLLWLSLGLETAVFLALTLGAIVAYRSGHLHWTAVLVALATLTRGDGLILAAVLATDYVLKLIRRSSQGSEERRGLVREVLAAIGVYMVVILPLLAWLTWQFGSPLPATLGAKRAQAELGITGFYAHTTYLQGLGILLRARLAQSPLYLLFVPAAVAGLVTMGRRAPWVRLVVAWGAAHLIGYTLLGVTPYSWYYAPVVPALVCLAALGTAAIVSRASRKLGRWGVGIGGLWTAGMVAALLWSDLAMVRALDGPVPAPDDPVSKVLPEAKVKIYEQTGSWLCDHTPASAVVGVTEVGVMGYYAERPMVDFLGLLEPEVAAALARGDLYWALLRYQPDYLALTAVSPLYAYDLRADPWFQVAYAPVQAFDDPRFWGSPVTVYERRVPRSPLAEPVAGGLPQGAVRLDVEFGGQIRLLGAMAGEATARPGDILPLTLYWEAVEAVTGDYTVFVHLLGQDERVIAQRDAPPGLGAQATSGWVPGQTITDPYLLVVPRAAYTPDQAVWEVGLYDAKTGQRLRIGDGSDNVRFGAITVLPAAELLRLDFGPVALTDYELDRLALFPGERLRVTLHWQASPGGAGSASVTVRLVGESGHVVSQASGGLDQSVYHLALGTGIPPGAYDLEVLVTNPATGQTLPLLGADGQPRDDRARLTKVRLYP